MSQDPEDLNLTKYISLFHYIQTLNMRHVRDIYRNMRSSGTEDPNMFFPKLGITAGEFSVAHVMKLPRRSRGN